MAIVFVYEPQNDPHSTARNAGWFDDSGRTLPSWFDRDLVEDPPKQLVVAQPAFFLDDDVIFPMVGPGGRSLITVTVYHPLMFDDADLIFSPIAIRRLDPPDRYLKNEVIRTR